MKKYIISAIVVFFLQTTVASANSNSVTPLQVLPQNLDMVFNLDLKRSPETAELLKFIPTFDVDDIFLNIANKNEVTIGLKSGGENYSMNEAYFLSVQTTKEQFETISKYYGERNGLVRTGDIIEYHCTEKSDLCFARLGKYLYMTNSSANMDELIMNFKNGERDVLGQNKKYMNSQATNVFKSTFDIYLDFKYLGTNFVNELKNISYAELYPQNEKLMNLALEFFKSLDYGNFSMAITDGKLTGRLYIKHNDTIKKLPFSYMDFTAKPNLYNYVDAKNMMFYSQSNNLAKRIGFLDEIIVDEFQNEAKAILGLFAILDSETAFAVRSNVDDSIPRVTFMANLKKNNRRKAIETVDALVKQIQSTIDAESTTEVSINTIKQGLYEITITLDTYDAELAGVDEINIRFGVNDEGLFIFTNDETAGTRHKNTGTKFEKNSQSSFDTLGTTFIDMNEIYDYALSLKETSDAPIDQSSLEILRNLELFTFKSYAGTSWVRLDFDLFYKPGVIDTLLTP